MNSNVFHVYKLKIKSLLFTIVTAYSKIYIYYNINDNYTIIYVYLNIYSNIIVEAKMGSLFLFVIKITNNELYYLNTSCNKPICTLHQIKAVS